ncbi:MAG: FxLYD domain-containing protein [Acidobacteriota bacterium]|jgi:hypothetical protein
MKARSIVAVLLVVALGAMFAVDALAQTQVSVQNPSFAWTGKTGQNANYRWSATIDNPSGRELNVRVTIELLDAQGNVVGNNSADLMLPKMESTPVEQTATIAVSTAQTAQQYRIVLMEVE